MYCYGKQDELLKLNLLWSTINSFKVCNNQLNEQLKSELPSEGQNKNFLPGWINEINEMRGEYEVIK